MKNQILCCIGTRIRNVISNIKELNFDELQEIRMRTNKPMIVVMKNKELFVGNDSRLYVMPQNELNLTERDIIETLELMSNYSLYAYEEELKNGYITLEGGHRVGLVGKVIMENGRIKTLKYIGGLNIRISHQVFNCAKEILPYIVNNNTIYHTLIVSPPRCGKTTILRDIVRQLSNGYKKFQGKTVGVVDERSEIAGCYRGVPQNDIGIRTDVLDACPKVEGMRMLLRSMAPQIIVVDEIGKEEDVNAINEILNAGIKVICTLHGSSLADIQRKPIISELIQDKIFERIIFLDNSKGPGSIKYIVDEKLDQIYPCPEGNGDIWRRELEFNFD